MNSTEYQVRSGDTLSAIARRYNVTVTVLAQLNGISDVNRIWAGQTLRLPETRHSAPPAPLPPLTYRVRAGDTLSEIAQRHHVTVDSLCQTNDIDNPNLIGIGLVLKIPNQNTSTPPGQVSSTKATATKSRNTTPTKASDTKAPKRVPFEKGKEIGCFGRVRTHDGLKLRATPGGDIKKKLSFNTRVFVSREVPGEWYFVTLDDGSFGYVASDYVSIHPPEPHAFLHEIKKGEGALQIVKQYYKGSAINWGQDERYYVNVLVEANRKPGLCGIYKPSNSADWSKTQTRENYLIWITSLNFAKKMRDKVGSGSISYELWQSVKKAAAAVGDFILGGAAFLAGVLHGALESVWDLVTGIVDLLEILGNIVKSLFTGEFLSDLESLWNSVSSMKVEDLVKSGIKSFLSKWDAPGLLERWHFRGWVIGYAIAEIVMMVITGAASIVKWAGKAGKVGKLIAKFPAVLKFSQKVTKLSKSIPESALKRFKGIVTRTSDEASLGKKSTKALPDKELKNADTPPVKKDTHSETDAPADKKDTPPTNDDVRFRSDHEEHIIKRDRSVKSKRGIGGAHNKTEFLKCLDEINVVKITTDPSLPGVSNYHYQMRVLDKTGAPTGKWREPIFQKTVYDPAVISDKKFLELGRQAAAQAHAEGKLTRQWVGTTPEGIKMRGYLDDTGAVRSFFFDLE